MMKSAKRPKLPEGLVSRTEAMSLLQLSRTAVRKLEDDCLKPQLIGGVTYYELEAVNRVLFGRSPEAAQLAFQCFQRGLGPAEAVAEHCIAPLDAERLWQAYVRLKTRHACACLIELPRHLSTEAWRRAHGYKVIDGNTVRTALELCARDPRLRRAMDEECNIDSDHES